jgi:hypothetical protein
MLLPPNFVSPNLLHQREGYSLPRSLVLAIQPKRAPAIPAQILEDWPPPLPPALLRAAIMATAARRERLLHDRGHM